MKNIIFFLIAGMLLFLPILSAAVDTNYLAVRQEAIDKADIKICDQLDKNHDSCVLSVIIAKKDISICNDVDKTKALDKICKAIVTLDTKYCEEKTSLNLDDEKKFKDNCYYQVAVNKKDNSLCAKIQDSTIRSLCPAAVANEEQTFLENLKNQAIDAPLVGSQDKSSSTIVNSGCKTDKECGEKICSNGKCIEPKMTILFVPFFWQGTNEEFDKTVDKSMDILLNALPLKDCKNQVKVLKLHAACDIPDYSKAEFYRALFDIKKCAERYTIHYNYVIGLTNKWDSFFGVAGGFAVPGFPVTLATASAPYIPAHEIGHSFGLKEEYCAGGLNKILGKCGFDIKKNPLKSEYGCREKDSPYDNDAFPDCCTSDSYLGDECSGNVGISESKLTEDIYNAGMYEVIDDILKNTGYIHNNLQSCSADSSVKEKLSSSLADLKKSVDNFYNVQKTTNFEFGSAKQDLDNMREQFISKCLAESDICGCLNKNSGYFYAVYSGWQDSMDSKLPSYPRAFKSLIKFNTRNIMTGPATLDIRSGPFEFSKPAYDYLMTIPKMQCSADTSTTSPTSVSETDKNSFYWNIDWIDLNNATTEKESSFTTPSGQKINGKFAYTLWNAPTCGPKGNICDCIDHIVLGTDSEPLYCFKAGIPWCYPGKSGETSFSFNAPATGTYTFYSLTTQTYNCNDAFEAYKTATNKKPLGKITVSK